jgi:hypothetical protein
MLRDELGFWCAVALVAIAGVALFKIGAATKAGDAIPGYRQLAAFI